MKTVRVAQNFRRTATTLSIEAGLTLRKVFHIVLERTINLVSERAIAVVTALGVRAALVGRTRAGCLEGTTGFQLPATWFPDWLRTAAIPIGADAS